MCDLCGCARPLLLIARTIRCGTHQCDELCWFASLLAFLESYSASSTPMNRRAVSYPPPGAPPTSSSTVTIRRRPNTQALPYFFLPVIYAHESLISWPTYAHSLEELVTVLSVVCQACFSVGSEAKSEKCCRRTSPENCDIRS